MRRRVLHSRIRASVVYACFQIQRERGMHPERKPVSTVVAEVLEAMITTLARNGDIAVLNDDDADREISKWLSEVGDDKSFDMDVSLDSLDFSRSDNQPEGFGGFEPEDDPEIEDSIESDQAYKVGEEIVKTITGIASQPRNIEELLRRGKEDEPEPEIPLPEVPPWERDGILSEEQLKSEVKTNDELAEQCLISNDEAMLRALQVVYSNIPRELWGTSRAEKLIDQVIPTVKRHLDERA